MKWIGVTLIAGSLLLPPLFAGDFYINLASQILIAAIFALSLNLLVGFGGMTSLGHACYLGVAAYTAALLTSLLTWPRVMVAAGRKQGATAQGGTVL